MADILTDHLSNECRGKSTRKQELGLGPNLDLALGSLASNFFGL